MRITATIFSTSGALLLCLLLAACRPARDTVLVYCTPDAVPYAKLLQQASDWPITLAPLAPPDLLAALEGTKAGDFVLSIGGGLERELQSRKLVRLPPVDQPLGVCVVSTKPLALADLAEPGMRVGSGKPDSPLDRAGFQGLPQELRPSVVANVRYRSARADELVRLVRLGTLDAALVWDYPVSATDLAVLPLARETASAPVRLVALSCSRLSTAEVKAILGWWGETTLTAKPGGAQ